MTTPALVQTTPAPTGRRFQVVLVLGLLIALGPLSIDMYLPAFPEISEEFGAADSRVQLTLTGMLLGLACGQLVVGPLSDALGRKRPLVVGLSMHALASLLCLVAPSVEALAAVRVLQGFAGAAVTVTAMAMVRDQFEGIEVARTMSRLMLVMGAAPMLAPTLGSQVLRWSDWRGIFAVLAIAAVLLVVLALYGLQETLPPERRRPARVRASLVTYRSLLADRAFLAVALIGGLMMSAMFAYIAAASFVFQEGFGISEQEFAVVFGVNAMALIVATQVNPTLLRRFRIMDVMTSAMVVSVLASTTLLVLGATDSGGVAGAMAPLTVVLACNGLISPNVPALALNRHGEAAGSAAAVLGFLQFGIGGAVAPVVGLLGSTTVGLGAVMATAVLVALTLMVLVVRRDEQVRSFG